MNVKDERFDANLEHASDMLDLTGPILESAQNTPVVGIFFSVAAHILRDMKEVLELDEDRELIKTEAEMNVEYVASILERDLTSIKATPRLWKNFTRTMNKLTELLEEIQDTLQDVKSQKVMAMAGAGNTFVSVLKTYLFGIKGGGEKSSVKKLKGLLERLSSKMELQRNQLRDLIGLAVLPARV